MLRTSAPLIGALACMINLFVIGEIHTRFVPALLRILDLASHKPIVQIHTSAPEIEAALNAWDGTTSPEYALVEKIPDTTYTRVLWAPQNDQMITMLKRYAPDHAHWGCNYGVILAVEFASHEAALVTQLHETLHCLGVEECYDLRTQQSLSTCDSIECVMRYGSYRLGACSTVLTQIRSHAS